MIQDNYTGDVFAVYLKLLQDERDVLRQTSIVQEKANTAVRDRQWADYENLMNTMTCFGEKIEKIEAARFDLMKKPERREGSFYTFAAHFPDEERRALSQVYQEIKIEAARVRSANDAMRDFLAAQISLVSGILEAAFPDRRGMIYGRYGKPRRADMRSVVFNRTF